MGHAICPQGGLSTSIADGPRRRLRRATGNLSPMPIHMQLAIEIQPPSAMHRKILPHWAVERTSPHAVIHASPQATVLAARPAHGDTCRSTCDRPKTDDRLLIDLRVKRHPSRLRDPIGKPVQGQEAIEKLPVNTCRKKRKRRPRSRPVDRWWTGWELNETDRAAKVSWSGSAACLALRATRSSLCRRRQALPDSPAVLDR